ncbi:class I SAM-dependent rRNA methyltransferase [Desulfuromonas sp. AOP6]|uniref:class I SAM-dependent rRNA methyltransferase n=1 Tax=Desulfuromonas sp. AOP6 TaxID=1566351 RepID=UPI00126ADD0E|nr:class I SAM-dependent rRNA methyltransferase [Desulfuromonas sp. AOP6]BCA80323.1 SAM-dependent methyltransferase [Desulfuromonas sp. AOP6]
MAKEAGFIVGPETVRMVELGHPWIIADRYTKKWPSGRAGDIIALVDEKGGFVATAMRDPGDRIVARVLSRHPMKLDRDWLERRVFQAVRLRESHVDMEGTNAYRLINGEGDFLPGLTVDRYKDHLMIQLYCGGWKPYLGLLSEVLQKICHPHGIYEKPRPQDTRNLAANLENKKMSRLLWGEPVQGKLAVLENGVNFLVDLAEGLNTGLFLDQRENRADLMRRVKGARVLNLFAYTGAFSVAAAAAGAAKVTSVDVSETYLDWAKENFGINRLNAKRHDFISGDCYVVLEDLRRQDSHYDIIIMDPPSFSTTSKSRFTTRKGTSELVALASSLLVDGGLLITSSNLQKMDMADYLKELRRGALQGDCELRVIRLAGQSTDFPYPVTFPEGRYLKYVMSVKNKA